MDTYHTWCNLREGTKDLDFANAVSAYMGHLKAQGLIEGYTMTRRKLGFGPRELGEFHVAIFTRDMAQLETAFQLAATRTGEVEKLHAGVYGRMKDFVSALYRDFPDPVRGKRPSA